MELVIAGYHAIAANYLTKIGIDFRIIDKNKISNLSKYYSRTTAINYNLCQNFQFLDIWDQLQQHAAPIKKILITEIIKL